MKSFYTPFNQFFIRIPKESLHRFKSAQKEEGNLVALFQQKAFLEALYVASPELYNETIKWLNGYTLSEKEERKLRYSLYKYYARMSSRCTPFGLFAGYNIGAVEVDTNIQVLCSLETGIRYRVNRLDTNYTCALVQHLAAQEIIREQLNYSPNDSIYCSADKLRYVEYLYGKKSRRLHRVTVVDRSEYLVNVLDLAKNGNTIANLAKHIVDDEITYDEAKGFVLELIDSQLLVSELEPRITEPDYWGRIIAILSNINDVEHIVDDLKKVKVILERLDYQPIGVDIEEYYGEIKTILEKIGVDFDEKHLFQEDMIIPLKHNKISEKIPLKVMEGIELLNKLSIAPAETNLKKFASEFDKRYEEREVELTMVLDPETGLGYPTGNSLNCDLSPLLDGLVLPEREQTQAQIGWDYVQLFLQRRYHETLRAGAFSIEITDEELKDFPVNKIPLPDTISAMVELIQPENEGGEERIIMGSAGGPSALCLIGRFCHTSDVFNRYALDIAQREIDLSGDSIIAEIVHLPEARTGNVLMHPRFFEYEIPYLASPTVDVDHTIQLSDLMISVRQNRIFLRSKRFNKQIVPRLSNAHNFSTSALPIYRFLCDLQMQDYRSGVGFHWGRFSDEYPFLPRVTYKDLILFEATWNLKRNDIEPFVTIQSDVELKAKVDYWRNELRLPSLVTLVDGDNELLVDLTSMFSLRVLFDTVKSRDSFNLKEYLHHPENNPVKDEDGNAYSNQLVFAFYKNFTQKNDGVEKEKRNMADLFMN